MTQSPSFFVPNVPQELQEAQFSKLAVSVHRSVPELSERLYSIQFKHDGQEWTATVGERLKGFHRRTIRGGGTSTERKDQISDPAVVLAIFEGDPYYVFTDGGLGAGQRSAWQTPFMAGLPTSITRFQQTKQF